MPGQARWAGRAIRLWGISPVLSCALLVYSVIIPGPLHFGGSIVRSLVEFGGRNWVSSPTILRVWISLCPLVACVSGNLLAIAAIFFSPVLEWKALNVYSLTIRSFPMMFRASCSYSLLILGSILIVSSSACTNVLVSWKKMTFLLLLSGVPFWGQPCDCWVVLTGFDCFRHCRFVRAKGRVVAWPIRVDCMSMMFSGGQFCVVGALVLLLYSLVCSSVGKEGSWNHGWCMTMDKRTHISLSNLFVNRLSVFDSASVE
jgi:hypothetical protein